MPVGFWNDGIVYSSLAFGFALSAASSASVSMPSCCMGTPTSFAPYERKVFRQPTKAGSSARMTSPSLTSTLVVRSAHCCPPETMNSSFFSKSMPCVRARYSFMVSRSGV